MQIPDKNCPKCPRLCSFRAENRTRFPSYHNAPVPSFGELSAQVLVVGLAPGLHGANQTGRPFTGDYAGFTLYESLQKSGFAEGSYLSTLPPPLRGRAGVGGEDSFARLTNTPPSNSLPQGEGGFYLKNCRITNAVRCVPQENKPEPAEIKNCNEFLRAEIAAMPNLKAILSLGLVSHNAVLKALGIKASAAKFAHGAKFVIPAKAGIHSRIDPRLRGGDITIFNSYHCSRYNINTGRLNQAMFDAVVEKIQKHVSLF